MKTWDEINVKEALPFEDFNTLFGQLPLNEEEIASLLEYYKMYELFVQSGLDPEKSWVTVRNIFAVKNQQIAARIKKKEKSPLKIVK